MKKFISYVGLIALMLSLVGTVGVNTANATVSAGAVTGNAEADLVVSTANADYNVVFDTDVGGANTATTITVTFPAAYTITGGALGAAAVQSSVGTGSNITANAIDVAVTGVAGDNGAKTIVLTIGATDLSLGAGVSFRILTGVTNPAVAGTSGTFTIMTNAATEAAQAGIAGVLITPAAVANLSCISSGSAGSVFLRWATPAGATAAYTAKYSVATINSNGTFNAATTFAQTWATGDVGVTQQQLVTILNPGTLYFFNLKAGGANASISPISNTVFCTAPTAASGTSGTSDGKAPVSTITAPTAGGGIQAGQPYTIKGGSSDTGGSSVKIVEVSLDGTDWMTATAVTSTATGFDWEYVWSAPVVGSYTIKSRATDNVGNIEVPGAGVTATVAVTLPSFTVETGGTPSTGTTPPSTGASTTNAQIQAQIDTLMAQVLVLLQQLLAQLQAQL